MMWYFTGGFDNFFQLLIIGQQLLHFAPNLCNKLLHILNPYKILNRCLIKRLCLLRSYDLKTHNAELHLKLKLISPAFKECLPLLFVTLLTCYLSLKIPLPPLKRQKGVYGGSLRGQIRQSPQLMVQIK